jgi:hypothetical protein
MTAPTRVEKVALWWTNSSVIWALAIFVVVMLRSTQQASMSSLRNPVGLTLWASGAIAVLGLGGVAAWRQRTRLGALLLLAYSLLWTAVLAYGLAWVWSAGAEWSVCLKGVNVCIAGWWARGILAGGMVPFVLVARWFWIRLTRDRAGA